MIKKLLVFLCSACFAHYEHYVEKWTEYRLVELLEHKLSEEAMSVYFSDDAWQAFQTSLNQSNINRLQDDNLTTRLIKFIDPINITTIDDNHYYAQAIFLLKFSDAHCSWVQPIELILTLEKDGDYIHITHFEGQTTDPIYVQHYKKDLKKNCPQNHK